MTRHRVAEWASLPTYWILKPQYDAQPNWKSGLVAFGGRDIGTKCAALKLYLAIVLRAEFKAGSKRHGCATITYDDFQNSVGLSRPYISRGLKFLVAQEMISASPNGRSIEYKLTNYAIGGRWVKLPKRHLLRLDGSRPLQNLSTRRRTDLNALRLYLLLLALKSKANSDAKISYDNIIKYTGMQRRNISQAISILVEYELITVRTEHDHSESKNQPNRYAIKGLA